MAVHQYVNHKRKDFPLLTRRTQIALAFGFVVLGHVLPTQAQPSNRISLEKLQAMFANMRAKTPWNVDGPLLWGYFFFDRDIEKLKGAATEFQSTGYRIVNLDAVQGRPFFRLHIERVEAHTPESLNVRNNQFYEFAEKRGIGSYDGMDVGPATKAAQ